RLWQILALALVSGGAGRARARLFTDRPPPIPPAPARDAGAAVSLVPPSGAATVPPAANLPLPTTQPTIAAVPPVITPQGAATPGQGVLSLSARYGKDMPAINGGLVGRVFADPADEAGTFKRSAREPNSSPNLPTPTRN